ncbi:hypothetical protein BU23DRAFT_604622 [Bimuria novae-zelandiae CBS 107.79]|uniref:Uncharacterized protein n=1 Tax=Bimuria novae-zelandiae CBS 107.79 TaxID=1447943 RepID=A0A6A5UJF4_9PLEO|nr:hypothetical protein BU23DRAFT_604622 [Bimuria novae-zelandiae CBS 107.79]
MHSKADSAKRASATHMTRYEALMLHQGAKKSAVFTAKRCPFARTVVTIRARRCARTLSTPPRSSWSSTTPDLALASHTSLAASAHVAYTVSFSSTPARTASTPATAMAPLSTTPQILEAFQEHSKREFPEELALFQAEIDKIMTPSSLPTQHYGRDISDDPNGPKPEYKN